MRKELVGLVLVLGLSPHLAGANGLRAGASPQVPQLPAAEAVKLARAKQVVLLDARSDDERAQQGGIPGARRVPEGDLAPALPEDKEVRVVVVCAKDPCSRGQAAVQAATAQGHAGAALLQGGFRAWKKAGGATVEVPRLPAAEPVLQRAQPSDGNQCTGFRTPEGVKAGGDLAKP